VKKYDIINRYLLLFIYVFCVYEEQAFVQLVVYETCIVSPTSYYVVQHGFGCGTIGYSSPRFFVLSFNGRGSRGLVV
jgi:hypothetical protein